MFFCTRLVGNNDSDTLCSQGNSLDAKLKLALNLNFAPWFKEGHQKRKTALQAGWNNYINKIGTLIKSTKDLKFVQRNNYAPKNCSAAVFIRYTYYCIIFCKLLLNWFLVKLITIQCMDSNLDGPVAYKQMNIIAKTWHGFWNT